MQYKVWTQHRHEYLALKEEVLIIGIWAKGDDYDHAKPYAKVWTVL